MDVLSDGRRQRLHGGRSRWTHLLSPSPARISSIALHRRSRWRRLLRLEHGLAADTLPGVGPLMLPASSSALVGGMPIGFALALAALIFIWVDGSLPGVILAQQMARGIDNFVLLAIPFFILVGYLMEANGMSVRLIELLERLVGRHARRAERRHGAVAWCIFSGISGSKMADVAAVGSVLIPAARRTSQNPGSAVALLAASAVMAETIPPCINLIILGFVANLSIGGLFMAGLLPAGLMALTLIVGGHRVRRRGACSEATAVAKTPIGKLWGGAAVTLGLIVIIFGGFKSGIATATEISAFAAMYALVVGGVVFRELGPRAAMRSFVQCGDPLGAGAVHRRRGPVAGLRADPAADPARAGRAA